MRRKVKRNTISKEGLWQRYGIIFGVGIAVKVLYEIAVRSRSFMHLNWKDIGVHGLLCMVGLLIFHFLIKPLIDLFRVDG